MSLWRGDALYWMSSICGLQILTPTDRYPNDTQIARPAQPLLRIIEDVDRAI